MLLLCKFRTLLPLLLFFFASCTIKDQSTTHAVRPLTQDTLQIDNSKDTLVVASKGTGLFFKKQSFELKDGTAPKGNISICVMECYSASDMFLKNLTTTSDGNLLESAGIVHVTAFAGREELHLKRDKSFLVHFPQNLSSPHKLMTLFYAIENKLGEKNWKIDSGDLFTTKAILYSISFTGKHLNDHGKEDLNFKGSERESITDYFNKHFDQSKLKDHKNVSDSMNYVIRFVVNTEGRMTNVRITKELYDRNNKLIKTDSNDEPYLSQFCQQLPPFEPFYDVIRGRLTTINSDCRLTIRLGLAAPGHTVSENYSKLFDKKGGPFKGRFITSTDEAELNYYIFDCSKLGWMNCSCFWNVPGEKINYYIKTDPQTSYVMMVFKNAKTIMEGSYEGGGRYVFKNVPVDQPVNVIVGALKERNSMMAIADTKTSRQTFSQFKFIPFTISELEKRLNTD